jgi:hypothetical protein
MPDSFDTETRGPSNARLFVVGVVFLVTAATAGTLLIAKSRGALDSFVRVTAELVNVGDGLPVNRTSNSGARSSGSSPEWFRRKQDAPTSSV